MSTLAERQTYFQVANYWFIKTMVNAAKQNHNNPEKLRSHLGNLLSALQQADNHQRNDLFVEGTLAMARYWETFGDYEVAASFHERCAQNAMTSETKACALFNLSYVSEKKGDYAKSLTVCEEGLQLARQTENKTLIVDLIWQLSRMLLKHGNIERVELLLEGGLQSAKEEKYQLGMGRLLNAAGYLADNYHADYEKAAACFQQAIPIATTHETKELLADLCLNLGIVHVRKGEYAEANEQFEKALAIAEEIGHREQICHLLLSLSGATINLSLKNWDASFSYVQKAMKVASEIGHQELLTMAHMHAGTLAVVKSQFELADMHFQNAYNYVSNLNNPVMKVGVLSEYGKLFIAMKNWGRAWEINKQTLSITKSINLPEYEGKALFGMAQAAQGQGNLAQAKRLGAESLLLFQRIQNEHANEVGEWLKSLPIKA
ncbi:MAG: tetratricopeptide repeat protein [Anaerolineales bacterium]|nr:tetratricopeptide repeat protein [Anaerolineales bacterium]